MNDNEDWLRNDANDAREVDELRERVAKLEAELTALRARAVPVGPEGWEVTEARRDAGEEWQAVQAERDGGGVWLGPGEFHWATMDCNDTAPTLEAACAAADAALGVGRG